MTIADVISNCHMFLWYWKSACIGIWARINLDSTMNMLYIDANIGPQLELFV